MESRRKIGTLVARGRKIWFDDEKEPFQGVSNLISFLPIRRTRTSEDEADFLVEQLKEQLFASRYDRAIPKKRAVLTSFATHDELDELEERVTKLEQSLEKTSMPSYSESLSLSLADIVSRMSSISGVSRVYYLCDNKSLELFFRVSRLSDDLLEKISEIEIEVSRKHPDMSIEIEPVLCEEDIPHGSRELLVNK